MPHVVLAGALDLPAAAAGLADRAHRHGRVVCKMEQCWLRADGRSLLVEGVVVEFARALHPVAVVSDHHGDTRIHLWPRAEVEKTEAVQLWIALLAAELQRLGAGRVVTTNVPPDLLQTAGVAQLASSSSCSFSRCE